MPVDMRVRIYPVALGKIIHHAASSPSVEVAGLMIGRERGGVIEVWDAVTGPQVGTAGSVQLDELFMAKVADALHSANLGLYIVGWYHSHPGLSVFMSAVDVRTQLAYQAIYPKSVALVIDPSGYLRTKNVGDAVFKVFHVNKDGVVVEIPASIGLNRNRVIESTIAALRGYGDRIHEDEEAPNLIIERAKKALSEAGKKLLRKEVESGE